jgi:hypothetical protein
VGDSRQPGRLSPGDGWLAAVVFSSGQGCEHRLLSSVKYHYFRVFSGTVVSAGKREVSLVKEVARIGRKEGRKE